jgi:hypothetical protein
MTPVSPNATVGYNTDLGPFDYPYTLLNECSAVPQPKDGVCGLFQQPCRSDVIDNPALDYTGTFEYRQYNSEYRLTHASYEPGYGCDSNLAVLVIQTGQLEQVQHVNMSVPNGVAVMRRVNFVCRVGRKGCFFFFVFFCNRILSIVCSCK